MRSRSLIEKQYNKENPVKRFFDRQEKQFKAIKQLHAMICGELKRIEGYDSGLAQRIRDRIGPKSGWTPSTYDRIHSFEREPQGSMG
jgi:hypothetical protein